jgi:ATP-dependent helicase HrpB
MNQYPHAYEPSFPLPIDPVLAELARTVASSRNTVLHAPPGAGKTTRVPLALLNLPELGGGRIVMLEPRRLATVHAAHRMASSLGEDTGGTVGYAMRFERRVSGKTRIEVVTEGILTRRLQRDPCLEGISLVIFDEFHERSIHADLALAFCLEVQREVRPDLRILVMSATLDTGPVAALLGDAPIVASEGRSYPVEVRYLEESGDRFPVRMAAAVRCAVSETEGDILAFLPGSGEIRACREILRGEITDPSLSIHPLYGDLPFAEQERAILPGAGRKVVLSTNIAETSLTIEGVRVVVDGGLSRMVRHDPSSGLNRLVTVRESRSSAEQRTGRAGRLSPGVCYRLFGSHTFRAMTPFSPPEILVSDLSSLVLELAVWGVRAPDSLSWLDPLPVAAVAAARGLLRDLGAFDRDGRPTETGRRMAELPVHPRLARLLLRGKELGMEGGAALVAALLSERDIFRYGPGESARVCESDLLERYEAITERTRRDGGLPRDGSVRAVERTAAQLSRLLEGSARGAIRESPPRIDDVSRLLLAAYPDRIAGRREDGGDRYLLATGRGARLSPKSGVRGRPLLLALQVDAGTGGEGLIHLASSLTPELIRAECGDRLLKERVVSWDQGQERVLAWDEERIGAVALSRRQASASDEEALPVLLEVVRNSGMEILRWERPVRLFQGRARLVRTAFPEEEWPDLSTERLMASLSEWLVPYLYGVRSRRDLACLDLLAPLRSLFNHETLRLLDERAPTHVVAPSGRRVEIDYLSGEEPILAVKLQEMFGLMDTPVIAAGRVSLLLHLLSPAGRPVQVTRDLRNFWESGYREVKRELKGRYPKHPWPDDPWNAVPTGKTNRALRGRP